jgi:hypothetical protein
MPADARDTLAAHYQRLTGLEAARRLFAEAEREPFVSIWLLARAVGCSTRRVRRDWTRRGYPVTRIGREDRLPAELALATYFTGGPPNQHGAVATFGDVTDQVRP